MEFDKPIILGLIGFPLKHSLSPILHRFLLHKLGLVGAFHTFEMRKHQLKEAMKDFREIGLLGFNVTIPHKENIMMYLDRVSDLARTIGSVNTVTLRLDNWLGENTDVLGFEQAMQNHGFMFKGTVATVLGAGGAARSVVFAMIRGGAKKIYLFNRTLKRAQTLAESFGAATNFSALEIAAMTPESIKRSIAASDCIINTTSVGMWPQTELTPYEFDASASGLTVVDLVYNPLETRFLQQARAAGATTVDGLDMLIFQGVESLKLWLQRDSITFDHHKLRNRLSSELKTWQNSDT